MMISTRRGVAPAVLTLFATFLLPPVVAEAQSGWLTNAVKRAVRSEASRQAERAVRNAIRCAVGELKCYEEAKKSGKDVVFVDASGKVIEGADGKPVTDPSKLPPEHSMTSSTQPVDASYDFKPGERLILSEDYSRDTTGDFPRAFELVRGNWDVVTRGGTRMLRNTGPRHSAIRIPLPQKLPERFTIEFDVLLYEGNANLALATSPPDSGKAHVYRVHHYKHNYFDVGSWGVGVTSRDNQDPTATIKVGKVLTAAPATIRIMADGRHVKMYVGDQRVANVPNADLVRGDSLWIENTYAASEKNPIFIGPIRVAAGGRDLYDALAAEGRVAVHDILFATDSAAIRNESASVLADIASMLRAHPELLLMIEGHTDSTGDFDHNMDLSRRRAESVKSWLAERHGVSSGRLKTLGLGSTQPKQNNDSEEGRRENRRVELVKIG